ncbi:Cc50C22.6-like-1 protein [Microplitis demolitor]|nr:Cc50C22.6-like-1 protein [Microplitis demolitor]
MICANKFIKNECLRNDGHPFIVLTDYFNNRAKYNRSNKNDSISEDDNLPKYNSCTSRPAIWTFLTYNAHDYTILRVACKLNAKNYIDDQEKISSKRRYRYIHFNPPYPIDGNIIYSVAPIGPRVRYIDTKFFYPLHKLFVYSIESSYMNYQPLKILYGNNNNCSNVIYDVNNEFSDIDHFKILLSNLIWCDVKINYTIWEKCNNFINNYRKYREIKIINKCKLCILPD